MNMAQRLVQESKDEGKMETQIEIATNMLAAGWSILGTIATSDRMLR